MLIKRVLTAGILGIAVVAAIALLQSLWAGLLLGALWLLGVREWAGFAKLGTAATAAFVAANGLAMSIIGTVLDVAMVRDTALLVAALWWLVAAYLLSNYPRDLSASFSLTAGVLSLLPCWTLLAWLHSSVADGPVLVLMLLAIVWAADTGAFFTGRAIGRHKLAPRVSPGKTWEGVLGGLVLAGIVGAFAGELAGHGYGVAIVALPTAAVSILGDLNVSMFKRNAGLKDSGRLLPGHGGVLDRIDSVTAAAPMFVLGLMLVGIIT